MLFVDHYWDRKEQVPNGSCVEYSFRARDYSWSIHYYPNGLSLSNTHHVSIFVSLRGRVAKPVRARVTFTLLDRKGESVPGHSLSTGVKKHYVPRGGYGFDKFIRKADIEASEHLVNGRITIRCDVSVEKETPLCGLHDFRAPTDITFRVAGLTFPAHSCVFAARSPVFAAELAKWGTNTGKCIPMGDIPFRVFRALLHFVYWDALPEMDEHEESIMAEDLLAAADRFELPELKRICAEILSSQINENTVTQMLDLAIRHRCQMLHEFCIEFLEDHPALDAVMATDDDGSLLEHVAKSCPELLMDLCADWLDLDDGSIQNDMVAATDVSFLVGGETFSAHKCVLEARSPAFVAELFSRDTTTRDCIQIDDMPAQVFKTLLHFIYTDSLPEMNEQEESLMAEHLLAAADRFDLAELKLICEDILSSEINENTVTQILDLAIQHRCETLHDACIEFLEDHPALDAVMAADDGSLLEHAAKSCPQLLKDLCADWCDDGFIQNDMAVCT